MCPYRTSWITPNVGDLNHDGRITNATVKTEWYPNYGISEKEERIHSYSECSSVGNCDQYKGECKCYNGYEGSACQRTTCPSNNDKLICSGHGICENIEYDLDINSNPYTSWEVKKIYSCKCDNGYRGLDCSERTCQRGIDAVVSQPPKMNIYYKSDVIGCGLFQFNYTYDGITYTSEEIYSPNQNEFLMDDSRRVSYNNRLNDVVQLIPPLSSCIATYSKVHEETVIQCYNLDIDLFLKSKIEGRCIDTFAVVSETPEQFECGNNGVCNRQTGLCECYKGFSGPACDNMNEVYEDDGRVTDSSSSSSNSEESITNSIIKDIFDL